MHRSRACSLALLAPTLAILAVAGCTGSAEQPILQKFFQASRLRDNLTLGNIATVSFDPREDGQVTSFTIIEVSADRTQELHLRALAKEQDEARAADDDFTKRKKAYFDANLEAIDRAIRAERANAKLKGKDLEIQQAWNKWREETSQIAKRVSDARAKLTAERGIAELSASDPQSPIDATKYDGEIVQKDVTIDAQVRPPSGAATSKRLVITLQRARLKADGKEITGRWLVTRIRDAAGAGAKTSE
jgi:hypothetical protein